MVGGRNPKRLVLGVGSRAAQGIDHFADRTNPPPPRHRPQLRLFKRIREQRRRGLVHACGGAAFHLGTHGVEIDEPRLEQRLGDGFERGVGFAQEGDAVVEWLQQVWYFNLFLNAG